MEGLSPEAKAEGLGALAGRHHLILRGLSHYEVRSLESCTGEGLGPVRAGFLSGEQQKAESACSRRLQSLAGRVHRENLSLGIAGSAPVPEAIGIRTRYIGRYGIHMGAKYHLGAAPAEKQIKSAVADLHHLP